MPSLGQPARLQLPLLDLQVAREVGIVVARPLDEAVRVLAARMSGSIASPGGRVELERILKL